VNPRMNNTFEVCCGLAGAGLDFAALGFSDALLLSLSSLLSLLLQDSPSFLFKAEPFT